MSLVQRGSAEDKARQAAPAIPMDGLAERDMLMIGIGFLRRGQADRRESEVRDLIRLQGIKDSGIYRKWLSEEGVDGGGHPWETFCRLSGWGSRKNADTRLAALSEFGAETMRLISDSGIPTTGIKALLASPAEVRAEIEAREKVSPDDMRQILDHIERAHERADRERAAREKERKRADKAEGDLAKTKDRLIKAQQDARDAAAELKVERDKKKIVAVEEVKRVWVEIREHWQRVRELLGVVDPNADRQAAAEFVGELDKLEVAIGDQRQALTEEIAG